MSPETASISDEQLVGVSRRTLLRVALGAVLAAPVLAACDDGKPYESPSSEPPVYTPPSEHTGQPNLRTPDADPTTDVAGTQTPEATPTEERIKPEIAGHKLSDLWEIAWKSTEDPDLADEIRKIGEPAEGDPESTGPDPDYYGRAIVLGAPADEAKNKRVRLAVVLQDSSHPARDRVVYVTLPKGTVDVGSERVSLMPDPKTDPPAHAYRLRLGPEGVLAAFMTSANGKTWKVVRPHLITHSTAVGNGTYSNAHVL